mgnify:FL=1
MPSLTKVQSGFMEAQGALPLSSGTAAAPGLKFSDNAGTGMFSPSTGAIGLSTSGKQNALTIHTDGSVVINGTTSNVVGRLTVAGDGKDIVFGRTESTGTGGTGRLVATGNLVYVQAGQNASSGSSADLIFCNYGGVGERLRITTTGELVSTNGTLRRNVSDSSFTVSGDTASNTGANINLYGASHGSLANIFRVRTGSTERFRIASNGLATFTGEDFPYCISTVANKKLVIEEYTSYNANGGLEIRKKFPNGNVLPANYWLGDIHFKGWDGDQFIRGAKIEAVVEGTPANNAMPCGLRFSTNPGDTSTPERLRIDSAGRMGLGVTPSNFGTNRIALEIHSPSATVTHLSLTNSTTGSNGSSNGFNIIQNGNDALLYLRENGNITFSTTNTERLRIDSAGGHRIKCSESWTAANLAECNTTKLALNINQTRQGQTKGIALGSIGPSGGSTGIQAYDTSNDSANPLVINPFGGFMGLGTGNPRRHFHIHETSSATVGFQMTNGGTGESNDSQGFQLKVGSDGHAEIAQMENSNLRFFTNATERMRIASDGKTAIGGNYANTSSFGRTVLIDGTLGLNNDSGTTGMGFSRGLSNATYGYIGTGAFAVNGLNNDDFGISSGATGDLVFGTGASAYSAKLRILNNGHIAQGTDAPPSNAEFTIRGANPELSLYATANYSSYLMMGDTNDYDNGYIEYDNYSPSKGFKFIVGTTKRLDMSVSQFTGGAGMGVFIDGHTGNQPLDSTVYIRKSNNNDWGLVVNCEYSDSNDYGMYVRGDGTSSSYCLGVTDAVNWKFRVASTGTIYATNTTVASISDQRLKENIVDANSQWDDVKALKFRNFTWKEDSGNNDGKTYLGLIAQEVETISPGLVEINAQTKEDKENGVTDPEYKNVKYSIVWMKAMKALQEAMERIETLEERISSLEG